MLNPRALLTSGHCFLVNPSSPPELRGLLDSVNSRSPPESPPYHGFTPAGCGKARGTGSRPAACVAGGAVRLALRRRCRCRTRNHLAAAHQAGEGDGEERLRAGAHHSAAGEDGNHEKALQLVWEALGILGSEPGSTSCPPLLHHALPSPPAQVVIPDCGCRVIMASDGMWDHMSQSKAVQLVRGLDAEPAAAELVRWGGSVGMCGGGCRFVHCWKRQICTEEG